METLDTEKASVLFLPQDVLVEFFLHLHTFQLRHTTALVCKQWRAAHAAMQETCTRLARYGHMRFNVALEMNEIYNVSSSQHGPVVKSEARLLKKTVGFNSLLETITPLRVAAVRDYWVSYMDCGTLAHPWVRVSPTLWTDSRNFTPSEQLIHVRSDEIFNVTISLLAPASVGEPFKLIVDGTHIPCYWTGSLLPTVSQIIEHILDYVLTDRRCIQETWRFGALRALADNYPHGIIEHLYKHWVPCLKLRAGDPVVGQIAWRENKHT